MKKSVQTMNEKYQVLAVGFSDAADKIYAAGIENVVNVYDMRKGAVGMQLALFPLMGLAVTLPQSLGLGSVFTLASLVRSYLLRRLFTRWGV